MANKGRPFECQMSRQLSLWWTEGLRDDVFWHTHASGAIATNWAKKGRKSIGHAGDIQAVDPIGSPFLRAFALELKKGYPKAVPSDVVDFNGKKLTVWERFVEQASESQSQANSLYWMVIHKRDFKRITVAMPVKAARHIQNQVRSRFLSLPNSIRISTSKHQVFICRWEDFVKQVRPRDIEKLSEGIG